MNLTDPTLQLLRDERRRRRGTLLVWSLAAALSGHGLAMASRQGWVPCDVGYAWILEAIAVGLLGWWFKRVWRLDQAAVARALDTQWELRSRLETALELAQQPSALAAAQRAEVMRVIAGRQPPGRGLWLCALASLALAVCVVGTEGIISILRGRVPPVAGKAGEAIPPTTTPSAAEPRASLEWKSPESEIKATAIEEVPWVAYSNSTTGLKALTLVVDVNGEPKVSRPVEDTPTASFTTPGGHEIPSSLYLDELGVKPFDIVSYRLVGEEHQRAPGERRVLSLPQFIQIRELSRELRTGKGKSDLLAKLVTELKDLQLRLLKQNFLLLQTSDAKEETVWKKENGRVASEQEKLQGKAESAHAVATENHAPRLILNNLKAAGELMAQAGGQIAQTQNDDAAKGQTRALALITECQKFFAEALGEPEETVSDPFRDDQRFRLPPRAETPAGELEALAQRQREANELLNASKADGAVSNANASEQQAIGQQAAALADNEGIDPQARRLVKTASEAAENAARQLAAKDTTAAREPAAVSQASLEQAVAVQESAGRAAALALLEQSRRDLNTASRLEDSSQRNQMMDATRATLRKASIAQQRTGSAEAARRLAELTDQLGAPASKGANLSSGSAPNSTARAREVAGAAAGAQVGLGSPAGALSRATRTLRRAQTALAAPGMSGAERSRILADLELTGQEAEWLTSDTEVIAQARKLTGEAATLQQARSAGGEEESRHLVEAASQLALALEKAREIGKRDEVVRNFNPDDVDPVYRAAVELYFEHLSRDAVKH